MGPGSAAIDPFEDLADAIRRELGVCTLSISVLDGAHGELRTLVNAGTLGPGEQRRPLAEHYPLASYPAAAALVRSRRPYAVSPSVPGDPASQALAAALAKTSQAGAPIVAGDRVWGELWVGSTAGGLPVSAAELPLIAWAAERVARLVPAVLPAGDAAALAGERPTPRAYEIWVDGRIGPRGEAHLPAPCRHARGFTVCTVVLTVDELQALLAALIAHALPIAAVLGPDEAAAAPPEPARGSARHLYEIRRTGAVDTRLLDADANCSVATLDDATVITAALDGPQLTDLLSRLLASGGSILRLRRVA